MSDVIHHSRENSGEAVPEAPPTKPLAPQPPWISPHWFGPIVAKYQGECIICEAPTEPGERVLFRRPGHVMCLMCAGSIKELKVHATQD